MLESPNPRTSRSLNFGLHESTGIYVVRIDARSRVEPGYIRRCVDVLAARSEVGVVGGAQIAETRSGRAMDLGIARALRNRWTTGLSRYRCGTASGAADTVWMGVFRRADLLAIGGWNPAVALNEDFELCERYRDRGSVVWFDAELRSGYLPRPDLLSLARQYFFFGRVKGTWWARGQRLQPRHAALLTAPAVGAAGLWVAGQRIGWARATALAAAALVVVEIAGTENPKGAPAAHAAGAVVIATSNASWWFGTLIGFAGEAAGVMHRHG